MSIAIKRAEVLDELRLEAAAEAWREVMEYEKLLAGLTSATELAGGIARVGAISAALAAGHRKEAQALAARYRTEVSPLPEERLRALDRVSRKTRLAWRRASGRWARAVNSGRFPGGAPRWPSGKRLWYSLSELPPDRWKPSPSIHTKGGVGRTLLVSNVATLGPDGLLSEARWELAGILLDRERKEDEGRARELATAGHAAARRMGLPLAAKIEPAGWWRQGPMAADVDRETTCKQLAVGADGGGGDEVGETPV
ncbi:MAG: hypothetical protein R2729_18195 [Bryobacteraceae bacterium]